MIAEGEVLRLIATTPAMDKARYLQVIRYKTAKLFEAAAQLGAILGGASAEIEQGWPPTACIWARHSRSSTTCSTTRVPKRKPANTSSDDLAGRQTDDLAADSRDATWRTGGGTALVRNAIEQGGRDEFAAIAGGGSQQRRARSRPSRPSQRPRWQSTQSSLPASRHKGIAATIAGFRGYPKLLMPRNPGRCSSASRVLRSGRRSRRFESSHPDQLQPAWIERSRAVFVFRRLFFHFFRIGRRRGAAAFGLGRRLCYPWRPSLLVRVMG